jgi:hypothetical protein
MRYLVLTLALCIHFVSVLAVTVLEGEAEAPRNIGRRKLSAASRHTAVRARSDSFILSNHVEFIYANGEYCALHLRSL